MVTWVHFKDVHIKQPLWGPKHTFDHTEGSGSVYLVCWSCLSVSAVPKFLVNPYSRTQNSCITFSPENFSCIFYSFSVHLVTRSPISQPEMTIYGDIVSQTSSPRFMCLGLLTQILILRNTGVYYRCSYRYHLYCLLLVLNYWTNLGYYHFSRDILNSPSELFLVISSLELILLVSFICATLSPALFHRATYTCLFLLFRRSCHKQKKMHRPRGPRLKLFKNVS